MDSSRREAEIELIRVFISDVHNTEILQLRASHFIEEIISNFPMDSSPTIKSENVSSGIAKKNFESLIDNLRVLHPNEKLTSDITQDTLHKCVKECFLRTIGIVRGQWISEFQPSTEQFLKAFIDPLRTTTMILFYPTTGRRARNRISRFFDSFHPNRMNLQNHTISSPIVFNESQILRVGDSRATFEEVQVHFPLLGEGNFADNRQSLKVIVTRRTLLSGVTCFRLLNSHLELSNSEVGIIFMDSIRILRQSIILLSQHLASTIKRYRNAVSNTNLPLSERDRIVLESTFRVVEMVTLLDLNEMSVFTP